MSKTLTKGNIIVEDLKIGDTIYEYEYGMGIQSEVMTLPILEDGHWSWECKTRTDEKIKYMVTVGMAHYGPNIYDYKAYGEPKL